MSEKTREQTVGEGKNIESLPRGSQGRVSDPATWLDLYGDALFRFALVRVRDREAAEELVQETLLGALRARDKFAGKSSEKTWLMGILRHKVVDHFRQKSATVSLDGLDSQGDFSAFFFDRRSGWQKKVPDWPVGADDPLTQREFWEVLDNCLSKLPVNVARAFCLREVEGLATKDICNTLGITATNLGVRIYRARMWLRECLERNWFDPD